MCPSAPIPRRTRSREGRLRVPGPEELLQPTFVIVGAVLGGQVGPHGMDLLPADGQRGQEDLLGHEIVALGVMVGDVALIAPEKVNPGPGNLLPELAGQ